MSVPKVLESEYCPAVRSQLGMNARGHVFGCHSRRVSGCVAVHGSWHHFVGRRSQPDWWRSGINVPFGSHGRGSTHLGSAGHLSIDSPFLHCRALTCSILIVTRDSLSTDDSHEQESHDNI